MTQNPITSLEDLDIIDIKSKQAPQIIFKHSTRCNISDDAFQELYKSDFSIHYLDLLKYREVSDAIATKYQISHKSPQILIIKDGVCVYNESHWKIKNELIAAYL